MDQVISHPVAGFDDGGSHETDIDNVAHRVADLNPVI
jgi:hypothetical protein